MFPNTLVSENALIFKDLKKLSFIKDYYLAGGTALALQLGHRKSVDLDFFIEKLPPHEKILENFKGRKITVLLSDETGLNINLGDTKVSFLQYPYPLLEPAIDYEGIKLAGILDIACMKLNAVIQRGEKKDFYDLFEILRKYSLENLLTAFAKKFEKYNYQKIAILKSLIYFDDAEKSPEPILLNNTLWVDVKKELITKVSNYINRESRI